MNRLSYTSAEKYLSCPHKYKLHYVDGYRPKYLGSALFFGSAVDKAIEHLVHNKDLDAAMEVFATEFSNGETFTNPLIRYNKNDLDTELITQEKLHSSNPTWYSLQQKGFLIIEAFYVEVLPKIKRVIGTQVPIELENESKDVIIGKCDLIAEWIDDSIVAFDVKTSGMLYERESVQKSSQLATYFSALEEKYGVTKIGFLVGLKNISKNRIKICSKCNFNGSGTQFKTCNNKTGKTRCDAAWNETIDPKAKFQILIDNIDPVFQSNVLDNYAEVNNGIDKKVYYKNFNSCVKGAIVCDFYKICWKQSLEDVTKKK